MNRSHPGTTTAPGRRPHRRSKRRLSFLAALATLTLLTAPAAAPANAATAVAPPTQVRVPALAVDESSVTLVWEQPDVHAAIVDYAIYRDGVFVGRASTDASPARPYVDAFAADPANAGQVRPVQETYTVRGLTAATTYRFTVRSIDTTGAQSPDSAVVTQATTAVPTVFNVANYGAVGDGVHLDTAAIQAAIDACSPGGKVLIPAGVFRSGALWLKSDMTLQFGAGATLLGSADAADYPYGFAVYDYSTDPRFYSLLNAHTYDYGSLHDIRIVGPGTIDGNGWAQAGFDADGFPVSAPSSAATVATTGVLAKAQVARAAALGSTSPYGTRSNLITMRGVRNVYYGNFTARNPAQHTIVNLHDSNVTVAGLRLQTYNVNNADGVEFGNSDGLQVFNTVFDTGDDAMNFAAGLGAPAESDQPSGDAWIADNYFRHGHGAIVTGSHTGAWIQNILAEDNVINGTDVGLRMKTDPNNGGGVRRVAFRDTAIKNVTSQAFVFTSAYSDPNAAIVVEPAAHKAQFSDVLVRNVTVDGTGKEAIGVVGIAAQPHHDLHFEDVRFLHAKPASLTYLTNSFFTNVVFDTTPNPWVITKSTGLTFAGTTTTTAVTADAMAAPSWPAGATLTATADDSSATLSWTAATDNTAVADYQIYDGDRLLGTVAGTVSTYQATGLSPARPYHFRIVAEDATGNTASGPATAVTTTGVADTAPPVPPAGPGVVALLPGNPGTTWAALTWTPATDNIGVAGYRIIANGAQIATVAGNVLTYTATGLRPATGYAFTVTAVDAAGNAAPYPTTVSTTTRPPYDHAAPTWPSGSSVQVSAVTPTSLILTWTAATDDMAVTGYRVYANGTPLGRAAPFTPVNTASTVVTTTYAVSGLTPGTRYTFTVQAGDAAGKWSGRGPSVTVSTPAS